MSETTSASSGSDVAEGAATRSRTPRWITIALAVLFGLFYVYDMWEAIGNLVGLNLTAQSLDTQLSGFGWTVLIFAVLMPLLVFTIAFVVGRRRSAGAQAVIFFVGLCLVAVLSIDILVMFGLGRLIV
ncbi:hypothetical protein GCM10022381_12400 [Leifsonia kafniensis]|uniref:Bacitracin resistance protein n=1 Tax=Leifsonia kafniensis TaxID=475957 RepID=A0ABP7KA31_9MICO